MIAAVCSRYSLLIDSYKHLRNKVNKLNQQLKRYYFSNKMSSINGDMKETWKVINQLINKCSKTADVDSLNIDDQLTADKFEISNAMND